MQEITLKDSGITVKIKKVSPLLYIQLRKQNPPPKPPKQKVTDMNGREAWEENTANPEYLEALAAHEAEQEEKLSALTFKRGVQVEVDHDAVKELREFWRTEFGKELPEDDFEVYVRYIVIQSNDDFEQLYNAIITKSQPTAEDVNTAKQSFPSKV